MTWELVTLILGLALIPALYMWVWGHNQREPERLSDVFARHEAERADQWKPVQIPVEYGNPPPDAPDAPEIADIGGYDDGWDESDRLLTEMPQILNPIDPMDGVLPEIDRDWIADLDEAKDQLSEGPE